MRLNRFIALEKATELYKLSKNEKLKSFMKDQLLRAASSIALNLAEGNERRTNKDRLRFFNYALTSLREVQSICSLEDLTELSIKADKLGAILYVLNQNLTDTVTGTGTDTD